MSGARIRPATVEDLDQLLALWTELADGWASALPGEAGAARVVLERIVAQDQRQLLVAEVGPDVVAGTLDVLVVDNITHGNRPWAVVENVAVRQVFRRQGIARALVGRAIDIATQAGCYKVQLTSGKQREGAHAFYRSVGFEAVAEGFKYPLP